jgi:hypothetical protein
MERSRTFLRDFVPEAGAGEADLWVNEEDRAVGTGGFSTGVADREALLLPPSPTGMGSVGLSGSGVLLHLLPCLNAGGTPRRWLARGVSGCASSSASWVAASSGESVGDDLCWRTRPLNCDSRDEAVDIASGVAERDRRSPSDVQLGFTGKRFPGPRRLEPVLLVPGAGGDERELKDDEERDPPYLAIFRSATSSWYKADKIREVAMPLRY